MMREKKGIWLCGIPESKQTSQAFCDVIFDNHFTRDPRDISENKAFLSTCWTKPNLHLRVITWY